MSIEAEMAAFTKARDAQFADKPRQYPTSFKASAVRLATKMRAAGRPVGEICLVLGVSNKTLLAWSRVIDGKPWTRSSTMPQLRTETMPAMARVVVESAHQPPTSTSGYTIKGPRGLVLEHLDLPQVVALLEALA